MIKRCLMLAFGFGPGMASFAKPLRALPVFEAVTSDPAQRLLDEVVAPRFVEFLRSQSLEPPALRVQVRREGGLGPWSAFAPLGENVILMDPALTDDTAMASTLVHELQHVYRNAYLARAGKAELEETWLAEGTSRLYEALVAHAVPDRDLGRLAIRGGTPALMQGFEGFVHAERELSDAYTHAFLFVAYAYSNFGRADTLAAWMNSPQTGRAAFERGLALPQDWDFDRLYENFGMALALNTSVAAHPEWSLAGRGGVPGLAQFRMTPHWFVVGSEGVRFEMGPYQTIVRQVPPSNECFDLSRAEAGTRVRLVRKYDARWQVETIRNGFCVDPTALETVLVIHSSGQPDAVSFAFTKS